MLGLIGLFYAALKERKTDMDINQTDDLQKQNTERLKRALIDAALEYADISISQTPAIEPSSRHKKFMNLFFRKIPNSSFVPYPEESECSDK